MFAWLLSRFRPLLRLYLWWMSLSPPVLFVASFAVLIAIGTLGLSEIPALTTVPLAPLDAFFTMTSAVCVTGLTVVDTASRFTRLGQAWILLFIQLGGLGVFTLTTLIIGALGQRLSLRSEMIAGAPSDVAQQRTVFGLARTVVRFTLSFELAGMVLLWVQWIADFGPVDAAWHALFHAVSAFCNAGFSTFATNLVDFAERPQTLVPLTLLVVAGGFGFLSIEELGRWWRSRGPTGAPRARLSSHTFASLTVTFLLLLGGTLLFAVFEWHGVLGRFSLGDKLTNAWTLSVMPRTAGFNAVSYAEVTNASAYLTVLLMFVGGAPGSTAGGIKTTALAVLVALAVSRVRGRRFVVLHGRTVPDQTVQRTVSLTLMAFAVLVLALFVFSYSEAPGAAVDIARRQFLPHLFELVSALGTVGLSMDLTPTLSVTGKLVTIGLMFMGRVGPLAFFAAVALKGAAFPSDFRLAREDVIVG